MPQPIAILAMTNADVIGYVNIAATSGMGLLVWWLGKNTQDRKEQLNELSAQIRDAENKRASEARDAEAKRQADVKDISDKLHDANTKLIDTRFREVTHHVKEHAQAMTATMDLVTRRVGASEDRLTEIGEGRMQAQIELTKAIGDLREFVRTCAVGREEFAEVKTAIKELTHAVNQVERENVNTEDMRKLLEDVLRRSDR